MSNTVHKMRDANVNFYVIVLRLLPQFSKFDHFFVSLGDQIQDNLRVMQKAGTVGVLHPDLVLKIYLIDVYSMPSLTQRFLGLSLAV